ncbi:MAG: hypothetical protein KAT40_00700 [Bacteroidales bacterium]|nr:hypothetical protein [Bacteroidales bacterium]
MKCDACPACPVRRHDCIGVKFEARKSFTRVGAYFTVVKCKDEKRRLLIHQPADRKTPFT